MSSTGKSVEYVHAKDVPLPAWQTFILAGGSGCVAWCFTHPFEMWKNNVLAAPRGTSQLEMLKETQKRGFYRGFPTGLLRQTVYATSRLGLYPYVRAAVLETQVKMGIKETADVTKANLIDRASAAALAGAIASFLSSPVDVCLVLQTTNKEKVSLAQTVRNVLQTNGYQGFWRGYGALGTRAALGGASQVGVHDHVLTHLRHYNAERPAPIQDNWVINLASIITGFVCSTVTMPFEYARVQLSMEAKKPKDVPRNYTNTTQCLSHTVRNGGIRVVYESFFPYFIKYTMHTIVCFFVLEYGNRELRARKARQQGKVLLVS